MGDSARASLLPLVVEKLTVVLRFEVVVVGFCCIE